MRVHGFGHEGERGHILVRPHPSLVVRLAVARRVDLDLLGRTTAQPPSALTPRSAASACGCVQPMPLQCGT